MLEVDRQQVFLCCKVFCTRLVISFSTRRMPMDVKFVASQLKFTKLPTPRVLPNAAEFMKFSLL